MERCTLTTIKRARLMVAVPAVFVVVCAGHVALGQDSSGEWFAIRVVDGETGRGVPLVELKTTNNLRYVTDSHGVVAFCEPGLMDREVFFHVASHGYEYPKDGFGYRGVRLKTRAGGTATVEVKRINIAERLYRVTGQGIYRDSVLTGRAVPLKNPVLNGQVMGQDSVFTCLYRGRVFWMWGDTGRVSYPLGLFEMSGAVSDLPGRGGLDPSVGVDLEYYVDESGFSRPVAPLKEHGLVWLDGLLTVTDPEGAERMVAKFALLKGLDEVLERGLMVFNDGTETFEPIVRPGLEFLPYRNTGHAFEVEVKGQPYYYFTSPSPMGVRLRVRARWDSVVDANEYEVLTGLVPGESGNGEAEWVAFGEVLASMGKPKAETIEALEAEAKGVRVYDVETGKAVSPHNGTVYYNAYRRRWVGIFVQHFGDPSVLGEVWYGEADTPVGPWAYVRRIVTHNKYSFYNPKHHPLFDQDGGRTIYFEGTYSHTFSGSPEHATPRYDYNQIMYRLRLDDARLVLPAPVYQVRGDGGYLLRDGVEKAEAWERVEGVAFYAVEPGRAGGDYVAVYAQGVSRGDGLARRLSTERSASSGEPFFYALPGTVEDENARIVPLFEYRRAESGQRLYSTRRRLDREGWVREEEPLCRVWRARGGPVLLDREAGAMLER